ncbi:hypothetical protein F5876DRAFT_68762 [Lentinula aff. lateritia]|uniref:Uncharacterized protein n=1 Tax=Lentinula aff. lateritia TaxID=2804960 RepID=A0ACC1TPL0_9AGAR|nr:hypothetical protein F5876DRAFT_68762 [Lentinula aff. lateritia]
MPVDSSKDASNDPVVTGCTIETMKPNARLSFEVDLLVKLASLTYPHEDSNRRDRINSLFADSIITPDYRSVPITIRTMKMQDGSKESAICFGTQYFLTPIKDPENPNQFKGSSVQRKSGMNIKQYTVATADFGYKTTEQFKSTIEHLGERSASSSVLWMHETLQKMVANHCIPELPSAWTTALNQQGFDENANWLGNTGAGSSNGEAVRNPGGKQAGNGGGSQEVEGSRESTT